MNILSKQDIKKIKRLHLKKYRQQDELFLAEGTKIVSELLYSNIKPKSIIISQQWQQNNELNLLQNSEVYSVDDQTFQQLSSQKNPEGILAVCKIPTYNIKENTENEWSIALDFLQDPGNLGTIIRIADWFGVETIYCSTNTTDAFNSKVVQATMGSIARVKLIYTNLKDLLGQTKQPIYGATLKGESIYKLNEIKPGIILIGNESNGISEELTPFITNEVTIPKLGGAESLNAGIATGIILSHLKK